jgi:hypothetical protein
MSDKDAPRIDTRFVNGAYRKAPGSLYPEMLIGDDDELLQNLRPTAEPDQVVRDVGKPALVLRGELTSVAIKYNAFNFNTEDLQPHDARSEALILSFLELDDFTFTYPDVYSVLSEIFHLRPIRKGHAPPRQLFKRTGILELRKSTPELKRPDIATLNALALRKHQTLPFVTGRVIERLNHLGV